MVQIRKKRLLCKFLNTTACFVVVSAFAHQSHAAPEGSLVTSGAAAVTQSGINTVIQQSSDRAIIKWNSFDLAQHERVEFQQPSSNAITINRIMDSKASQIDGQISANGKLVMINPNGIVFGATSKVDVGSLVATTSDIEDDVGFMAGSAAKFTKSGRPDAKIINAGTITAKEAGLVGLVAPHVENSGVIQAKLGKIQLASGDIHTIDLAGDGLIQLEVSDNVISQSIKNTGTLKADGGKITLTAAQGRAALDAIISNHGRIQTGVVFAGGQSPTAQKGKIKISAPTTGTTKAKFINGGVIEAEGGYIEAIANTIQLESTSTISVASDNGGGSILIGGARQGGSSLPTAELLTMAQGAVIDASARVSGNGGDVVLWSNGLTDFAGQITSKGGQLSGNGGEVEVSGKLRLNYHGFTDLKAANGQTGNLLLDPTDIAILNASDMNVTGSSPFTPNIDDGPSILDIATLSAALSSANVTVQTRATGSQAGDITVGDIFSGGANTLTLDAHHDIIINSVMTTDNLILSAGNDIAINAALTGSGNLTIQGNVGTTIGIGTGQVGTLSLNAIDLGNLTNGWSNIIIGRTDGTGAMNVGALTWNDNLELRSDTGIITVAGVQSMGGNNLTLTTGSDVAINAGLTGTGNLTIQGNSAATTIGVGTGQTGALSLNATDLGNLTNGWSNIIIGRTDGSGDINVGARTWNDNLTYQTGTGIITVAGVQTMGTNALTISTNAASNINAGLTGTGTLTLQGSSAGAIMGLGTGQPGDFQFDTTDIANITNGWSNIVIGRTDGTGAINIGALTWNDNLTLQSLSAPIIITGTQTLGANNVTFNSDGDPQINAAMNSTGTLTFQGLSNATTIGFGTGQAGALSLDNTDISNADNTWSSIVVGRTGQTGAINAGGFTIADPLTIRSTTGVITVGAAINTGANNLTIQTDVDPVINAALTGTQTLSILPMSNTTTLGVGTGQTGAVSLSDAELSNITNGWTNIILGRTSASGAINIGPALTWNDPLTIRTTGVVTFNGTQNMASNALAIQTDSDPVFGGNLAGTGTFSLFPITTSVSIGLGTGQTGTIQLSDAELNTILNGWTSLTFGTTTTTGDINVGTYTWNDPLTLRTGAGVININGNQTMGANNLGLATNSNLNISGTLTGTGALTITPNTNISMGIGTGQAGTLSLTDTELNNISNGWASITFGLATSTGAVNVGTYTWQDNVLIRNGAGTMTIAGAQNMGTNNLSLSTNGDLALNAALTGTGTLTIIPTTNTTMGIGTGQAGTLSLTDAELNQITNGWTNIILGSAASTAAINIGAYSWQDQLTLRSGTGLMTIAGTQTMSNNALNIQTDSNLALNGNLIGTGTLTIRGAANATSTSIGTGQTGTLNLDNSEIARIQNGWTQIDFGQTGQTGVMNIGAVTWNDTARFLTNTGIITINGAQNMGSNSLSILTNADPTFNANLSGTGTLTIQGTNTPTTMGIGDSQVGTVQLSNSDLSNIQPGWQNVIFGSSSMAGAMNIGANNWAYDTSFKTGSGLMTINGTQNSGARNLNFETDSNLNINAALQGSGILTIRGSANTTSMGIGTGQIGTLSLTDTELNQLTDGWTKIILGQSSSTGAVNVGARTWNDPLQIISNTGLMTIAGAQNMGANDLTLETNSNLALNAGLFGTSNLTIRGAAVSTTIGVNGGTGTLALTTAEVANIKDGWGNVTFGRQDMTGAITLGSATWLNPTTFLTRGNLNITGVQSTTETGGTPLVFVTQAGNFTNSAGASGINPGAGRYLIYALSSGSTTLGGLSPATTINGETYFSLSPASVSASGNAIIYLTGAAKVLYVQIDNKSKIYGDALPTLTYTFLGGLQGSDSLASALTGATLTTGGTSLTDAAGSTWAITGGFSTGLGYTVNITDGVLTVVKAPIAVQIGSATRTYGAADPVYSISYTGFKNGENSSVIDTLASGVTAATATSNVGSYTLSTAGALDNNYSFNYGSNTLTITKANLMMIADDKTREYGDANPALTMSYSGLMNGENSSVIDTLPSISTTATTTTSPSTVAISLSGGLDNNYNINLVNGNLTITKANLSVTADNKARDYGDANPVFTATYSGFKNGETSAVIDTLASVSSAASSTTNAGTATISASGANDNNYSFNYIDGTLTINKALLTATAQNAARDYGDANPAFTATYSGFKNGETSAVIDTLASVSSTATSTTNVGTAVISASAANDNNYNFNYIDGTLTINQAGVTVQANDRTKIVGQVNPTLTYSVIGLKNGDQATAISGVSLSTLALDTSPIGSYTITASGGTASNYYIIGYADGLLSVISPPPQQDNLPSTVYYTNTLGSLPNWATWRDMIYFEDDRFIEQILYGRQTVKRHYVAM